MQKSTQSHCTQDTGSPRSSKPTGHDTHVDVIEQSGPESHTHKATPDSPDLFGILSVIHSPSAEMERSHDGHFPSNALNEIGTIDQRIELGDSCLEAHFQGFPPSGVTPEEPINAYLERVKSHAKGLLFPTGTISFPLNHPGVEDVVGFLRGIHPGPTADDFSIDVAFGQGSSWNLRACQVFSYDFCARKYQEADGKTHIDASYEFYRLLPSFLWSHATAAGFEHPERLESFHERFARQARKHQLTEARVQIASAVPELRGFLPMVRLLAEEDAMSSDEKDPDNDRYYYSIKPYWRNERVTHWLHDLDRIHSQKYSTESEPSTCRIPSGKVDMDCGAVGGLPLNFYDRCYLNNLETPQYKSLNSQPPIPLGFCPSIERLLDRNA